MHPAALKIRFIANPRSGRARRVLPAIRKFAQRHGASLVLTERSRHATELAQRALDDGCELIVAVGGDGTMNEVATPLIGSGAIFGLVPCGSGDGLGRHLGIHGSVAHALGVLLHGRVHAIDSGLADGHAFFTAAGIGFEAEIARRFNRLARRGFIRYLLTSTVAFGRWRPEEYVVSHAAGRATLQAFTLAVTNANQYGNNARIAPDARVDDGQLDLCVVPPIGVLNGLPLAARLFNGTIVGAPGMTHHRGDRFVVERAAPGLLHTDGEVHDAGTRLEFTIRPASLRVMVPQPASST